MNHLAHLLLAGLDPEARLGALLGDHLKGRLDSLPLTPGLRLGVALHRRIDGWSDTHAAVTALRAELPGPWRRYGGIVLDVLFDHMLARHWSRFSQQPLAHFAVEVDRLLEDRVEQLPPRAVRFARWAREQSLWCRCGDRELLGEIFRLLALRHGRTEPLARGLDLLKTHEAQIEAVFLKLFPELQERSRRFLATQA